MSPDLVLRPTPGSVVVAPTVEAQSFERLQHHKAVLESYGVTSLSSLGQLPISGNVVPQPGLTVPAPSVLVGEATFQAALRTVPGAGGDENALRLTSAGGRARLMRVSAASLERLSPTMLSDRFRRDTQLADIDLPTIDRAPQPPSFGPEALAQAIIPIDTAYWAAAWINLADNTTVVFKQPLRYLTIITEKLTVGNNVTFTWEKTPPGAFPQKLPKPAKKPRAPTPDGLWGETGEAGTNGLLGGRGPDGKDAPELELWVLEMTGYPAFVLNGQDGFQGGPGQDGGDGGDGSIGRAELYDFFGWCRSGPGNGGDGGPGGAAGSGGEGGNGGHGGRLSLYAPQPVVSAYTNRFYVTVDGGAQGSGGVPGTPGAGGAGGQVGASPNNCAPSTPRYAGTPGPQGAPGTQGPSGQPGRSHPDGIAFHPIDADDFRRKLTEPAITHLTPDRIKQGDVVSATGLRFSQTDRVLVDGVAVVTTVVSDTLLTFQVPSVQGGYRTVQIEQTDGTRSNRATLYVLPVVTSAQQGNTVKPGATVTLVGSGFAPGALVRVNEQDMPDVSFIGPTSMSFTLVRPSSVVDNPAGEQVSVRVVLADGTPSNEVTLVLDTFRMLALGDSVQWGQGLQEDQKFHSLVQAAIKARQGNVGVYKTVLAHSGATIGVDDNTSLPAIDGEVPTSYPTIMQQCDAFSAAPETVDLVLVDGGINDVNVRTILNPTTSTAAIRASTEQLCHVQMKTLLRKITAKFKNSDVVVTGYFPILTEDTNIDLVEALLIAAGVSLTGPVGGWAASRIKQALVANCRAFDAQATASLRAAVDEMNDWLLSPAGGGEQRPRIFFANPLFARQNAVLAPYPWLWGINGDSTPQDNLVASGRWTACNLNRTRTDLETCKRASMGHPNARGAQEYAKSIMAVLTGAAPPAIVNGDFETGRVQPWLVEGTAFANQPASIDRPGRRTSVAPLPVPLGGDYWQGGYDIRGPQGKWWISTDDGATGTLTSNAFTINASRPWFSCLVGGGRDLATLRVELLILATEANRRRFVGVTGPDGGAMTYRTEKVAANDYYVVFEAGGQGGEQMQRVAVNVGEYDGEQARVRIVDRSTGGHINADDFRFSAEQPAVSPLAGQDARSAPLWGFADLHTHPLSHLGFGGKLFWGEPDGPIERSLAWCDTGHGPGGVGWGGTAGSLFMAFFEGGPGHLVGGHPEFDGWPRFTTRVHQQMYVDWIRRAHQGGLRLMVALVVNNELLANEFGGQNYDDRTAVETQIQGLKNFVGRHTDFMEIAYAPADARRIIGQNKLAVILGVEVDSLGNWRHEEDAPDDEVRAYLHHLYHDLGVRHIFPIHLANNAFGGTAVYNDTFDVLNRYLRDDYYEVRDASDSAVQFRLGEGEGPVEGWYRASGWYAPPDYAQISGGHANILGLTRQGAVVVEEMMRLGMLIDVDHMSQQSVADTLGIAERHDYPLVAGHTGFRELAWRRGETAQVHKCPNEYQRTRDELARLRQLGGMVAVGLHQGDLREWGGRVRNDAAGSAKSWAQAYQYAIEQMGGAGVAIGTDMNGLPGTAAPRFGLNAYYDLGEDDQREGLRRDHVYAQTDGVRYDRPIRDYRAYRFEGVLEGQVYDMEERDIWEAIAIYRSGTDPNTAEMPGLPKRTPWQQGKIRNLAKGFRATSRRQLENPPLGGNTYNEQLAAYLVRQGQSPSASDSDEVKRLHPVIKRIWERWRAMEGGNPTLSRSYAGRRDFDINIDGVAHYGLLPDFLQDAKNVGLTHEDLAPLFRSAEDYIRVWEKSESRRPVPKKDPSFLFSTGFEEGDIQPTWNDRPDGGPVNVSGYFAGIDPECSIRAEGIAHSGNTALMYSGTANGGEMTVCYFEVFDVDVPITADTKLSYWIYPQHDNGRFVGVDFLCTDGTTLRDSGSVDQNGVTMHPGHGHGSTLPLNTWSQIKCDVGQKLAGKTTTKIWVAFDRWGSTGQFRGYIDDIVFTNGPLP